MVCKMIWVFCVDFTSSSSRGESCFGARQHLGVVVVIVKEWRDWNSAEEGEDRERGRRPTPREEAIAAIAIAILLMRQNRTKEKTKKALQLCSGSVSGVTE